MKIGYLAFTYIQNAGWHGAPCLELTLNGGLQASLLQIVKLIDEGFINFFMKQKIVCIDGSAMHDNDPAEVMELVQVLRSKGCSAVGICDGSVYPRWMNEVTYKVAIIREDGWLGFTCNEIQYRPAGGDKLMEPLIGDNNVSAVKALLLTEKRGYQELHSFNEKAYWGWTVLLPLQWRYAVTLIKE